MKRLALLLLSLIVLVGLTAIATPAQATTGHSLSAGMTVLKGKSYGPNV